MKKILVGLAIFGLLACSDEEKSTVEPTPDPVTVEWSLSGVFGGGQVDSVNTDSYVSGLISRSGSSKVHLNGYDTAYFENTVSLMHLQNVNSVSAPIDADGYFTFDNMELFGLCDGTNSIRVTPRSKANVILKPSSLILYTNR